MKKIVKILLLLLSSLSFCSCITLLGGTYHNQQIDIPFDGPMDSRFGYESLSWGTSYKKIKKDGIYPVCYWKTVKNYYIGELKKVVTSDGTYDRYDCYTHGDVEETKLFFTPETELLYMVVDTLRVKNPSLSYLHSRYGDFSEENVGSKDFISKGGVVYTNKGCFEGSSRNSLIIVIESSGKTAITIYDPFAYSSNSSPVWDRNYSNFKNNTWYCYSNIDGSKKAVNYTFIQKNVDNKLLIFGYHKSLESPSHSFVRTGFGWGPAYTSGIYEIKKDSEVTNYKFSSEDWDCAIIDVRFTHTEGEYRKMFETFYKGEKLTVRHNDKVTEFNPTGFAEILAQKEVSVEEIDYAISNEEF